MTRHLPSLNEAKTQAKSLRADLEAQGDPIPHARALEMVAHQYGFRDWNSLYALIGRRAPDSWTPGGRVAGRYLSQPFAATVIGCEAMQPGWFRLVLELDKAVDVVSFDSFSNFRRRISSVVGPNGRSKERSSNGAPHLELDAQPLPCDPRPRRVFAD